MLSAIRKFAGIELSSNLIEAAPSEAASVLPLDPHHAALFDRQRELAMLER